MRGVIGFLLGLLLGCAPAAAVDTAWDTTFGAPGVTYAASGGIDNRSVSGAGKRIMIAIDWSAKRAYARAPHDGRWHGASGSVNANIASVTGYDISAFGTSTMYWASRGNAASGTSIRIHAGSTIQSAIPSGYTTHDAACGGTTTYDSGKLGSGTTLSVSDSVMTYGGSGSDGAVATCGIALGTSAKTVVEFEVPYTGGTVGTVLNFGMVNSSYSAGADMTGTTNAFAYKSTSGSNIWVRNGSSGGAVPDVSISNSGSQNFPRGARANISKSSGKWYWEVTASTTTGTVLIGVVDSTFPAIDSTNLQRAYPGNPATGGFGISNGACWNITCDETAPEINSGDVIGFALDMDASPPELWVRVKVAGVYVWNGGVCGGAPNPETGDCPLSPATGWAGALYPAAAVYSASSNAGGTLVINGGRTAFTHTKPSGFAPLDPPRGRTYFIQGANDNLPACIADPRVIAVMRNAA